MKSFYTLMFALFFIANISTKATPKEVVIDTKKGSTISYYSFEKGTILQDSISKWHIALAIGTDGAIRINDAAALQLWLVPTKTSNDLGKTLDTTGMLGNWIEQHNSDSNWTIGAFNLGKSGFDIGDGDLGWGVYDPNTHYVIGSKLFVIKLSANNFKQIIIDRLAAGEYTVKYANLDGTSLKTIVCNVADYKGKNFVGISLTEDKVYDKEPLSKDWDIAGTKYIGLTPDSKGVLQLYLLTGFFSNSKLAKVTGQTNRVPIGLKVAVINDVDLSTNLLPQSNDYSGFINKIGYDWKSFNGTSYDYSKRVYFAQRFDSFNKASGLVYKFAFTKYSSNSTTFSQENLITSVNENENSLISNAVVYPNEISNSEKLNLVITSKEANTNSEINIYNAIGNLVFSRKILLNNDFSHIILNNLNLSLGLYFIQIGDNNFKTPLKFIIK